MIFSNTFLTLLELELCCTKSIKPFTYSVDQRAKIAGHFFKWLQDNKAKI